MFRRLRRPAIVCAGALVAELLLLSGPVSAGPPHVWMFPGDCPTATLQDCINGASPGDTIQIATDTPINEGAHIEKSLTLRAAAGFHPTISLGSSIDAPSGAIAVVIRDIAFGRGVEADFSAGSGHSVTLRHVRVVDPTSNGFGILLFASVPASFQVIGSSVDINAAQTPRISMQASHASGDVSFRIIGNHLKGAGATSGGGGLDLTLLGSGSTRADIYNNAIWDVAACHCAGESGIFIYPQGTGRAVVNVVGNTFDRVHSNTIGLRNDLDSAGHLTLNVFDNAISRSEDSAVYLGDTPGDPFVYRAGYNDFYLSGRANELLGHSQGIKNINKAPGYVDPAAGNFHLKSTSQLINKGLVCTPGGLSNLDAAGHARLAGPTVDIGAYEFGGGPETGRAFVGGPGPDSLLGTPGADIICGLGGADYIDGEGGNDYVDGGPGSDFVIGGPGSDRIFGGPGNDTVCSHDLVHGNDRVDGGTGTDKYRADSGDVLLRVEQTATCAVA